MKRILIVILVLAAGIGALGYSRGWFKLTKEGDKVELQLEPANFKHDKSVFSKMASEKSKTLKDQLAGLWKKTESLTGDDKTKAQKELGDLKIKHERIEKQLKELEETGEDKFKTVKEDLSKALEDVEKKSDELAKKLEKGKDK